MLFDGGELAFETSAKIVPSTAAADLDNALRAAVPLTEFVAGCKRLDSTTGEPSAELLVMHGDSLSSNKVLIHNAGVESSEKNLPVVDIPCYGCSL